MAGSRIDHYGSECDRAYEGLCFFVVALAEMKNVPATHADCAAIAAPLVEDLSPSDRHTLIHMSDAAVSQDLLATASNCLDWMGARNMVEVFARIAGVASIPDAQLGAMVEGVIRSVRASYPLDGPPMHWPDPDAIERMGVETLRARQAANISAGPENFLSDFGFELFDRNCVGEA